MFTPSTGLLANQQQDPMQSGLMRYLQNPITQIGLSLLSPQGPTYGRPQIGQAVQQGLGNYQKMLLLAAAAKKAKEEEDQRKQQIQWMQQNAPGMIGAPGAVQTQWAAGTYGPEAAKLQAQQQAQAAQEAWMQQHNMGHLVGAPPELLKRRIDAQNPMPTSEMLNYGTAQVDPGFAAYQQGIRRAGATQVNVGDTTGRSFGNAFGGSLGKQIVDRRAEMQGNAGIIDSINESRKLLHSDMYTGTGADWQASYGAALQKLGFNFDNDAVANTQAFAATMGQRVLANAKLLRPMTDADVAFLKKIEAGDVTLTKDALNKELDIVDRAMRKSVEGYNKDASAIMSSKYGDQIPLDLRIDVPPPWQPSAQQQDGKGNVRDMTNEQQGASFDAQIQGVPTAQANAQAMTGQTPVQAKPSAPVSRDQAVQEVKTYYQALLQKGVPEGQALEMAKAAAARRGYQ